MIRVYWRVELPHGRGTHSEWGTFGEALALHPAWAAAFPGARVAYTTYRGDPYGGSLPADLSVKGLRS